MSTARHAKRHTIRNVITTAAMAVLLATGLIFTVSACSSSHDAGTSKPAAAAKAKPPETTPSYPKCSALVGMPTAKATATDACVQGSGELLVTATADENGPKGHIYWNDTGWGVAGGIWQKFNRSDGQLVPPDSYLNR